MLEVRANQGLAKYNITPEQLRTITNHVAGVARFEIKSLYAAAELAVERSHEAIRPAEIEDSYNRALHHNRQSNLNSLLLHYGLLSELIRVARDVTAPELYERYDIAADQFHLGIPEKPIRKCLRRSMPSKDCG